MMWNFKTKEVFEKRKADAARIFRNYPDRIPVIVEKRPNLIWSEKQECKTLKYLAPKDLSIAELYAHIRKNIKLRNEDALFFLVNNQVPASTASLNSIYQENVDEDGFLYISYSQEATFG